MSVKDIFWTWINNNSLVENNFETEFPHLIIQAGVWGDYYTTVQDYYIMPRGGIKYEITPKFDIFVRSGLYNLYPFDIQDVDEEEGNPIQRQFELAANPARSEMVIILFTLVSL